MLDVLAALVSRPVGNDNGVELPSAADACCPQQWDYETSEAKFKLLFCSRRSGKTSGIRRRSVRRAVLRPGYKKLYVTLIRRNCRKLFWRPLLQDFRTRGIEFEANEVDMICRLENGSLVEATSCDDVRGAGKIRGDFYDDVEIDEAQEPSDDILEPLVEEVLFPSIIERGGQLSLAGTPPDSMVGYFIDRLSDPRWTRFGWSMFDNKYILRSHIDEMIEAKGLTPDHPVYQREILGLPVVDPEKIVYEYDRKRNNVAPASLDRSDKAQWRYSMGLDLGFQDADAIVLVGWRRDDPEHRCYVVHQWKQNHLDVDVLAEKVAAVHQEFRPSIIVGDHGGHAAQKILKTLETRLKVRIIGKPADVNVSIGLVNDDLRNGRLFVEDGTPLVKDLGLVTWHIDLATKKRVANKKGFHSDLADAFRYACWGARHWAAKAPKAPETIDERRDRQWADQQRREANAWR